MNNNFSGTWSSGLGILLAVSMQFVGSGNCQAVQEKSEVQQQEDEVPESIKLPMDPETVVFQLTYTGGYRMAPPKGFERTPRIRVFADGRVVTGRNTPEQKEYVLQLDDRRLHELMEEVVSKYDAFSIDSREIGKAIQATGRRIGIADVPNTEITIELADRKHTINVYAVTYCAGSYPEIEELQRLLRIEKFAHRLYGLAHLGGEEVLAAIVEFGNVELAKGQFSRFTLTNENMESAKKIDGEKSETRFVVRFLEANKKKESMLTVLVEFAKESGTGKVTTYLSSANE